MIKIGPNIISQIIQRSLGRVTQDLASTSERLASGLRINRASDDVAGLAIAESLSVTRRVLNQGIRNLNDGISLLNIADASLHALTEVTVRLTELAQQSANGTLTGKQRLSLEREAQSLAQEFNRIARTTEFNDRALFNGDFGELSLAAGPNGSALSFITSGLGGGIGDGTLGNTQSISVAAALTGVIAADVNGDGNADIVAIDGIGRSLSVLLNNGGGSFGSAITYSSLTANFPWRVNAADMNGDGHLDLITSDLVSGVGVLLNRGDGTFVPGVSYYSGGGYDSGPHQVEIVDINSDNILDVVTSNSATNTVAIYTGNGDGTLTIRSTFNGSFGNLETISTADYNNDGVVDLSISFNTGIQETLLGTGTGTFISASTFNTGFSTPYRTTESADFNNDGNQDLVLIANTTNALVYLGNGDGSFGSQNVITTSGTGLFGVTIADLNGDSFADLALRSTDTELTVALNNGNGTFSSQPTYTVPANLLGGWGNAYDIGNADFNNDGAVDLVIANPSNSTLSVLYGNASDGVSALQPFSLRTQADAKLALIEFRKTLDDLGQQRGEIGAFQARVSFAVSHLRTTSAAIAQAHSRIVDADMAHEAAQYVRQKILQEAATAILAQANQVPALALTLLQGLSPK